MKLMEAHWNTKLGLTVTNPLKTGWGQLQSVIKETASGLVPWHVLQLPTGSGKTEALKVLCASEGLELHRGVLIVTKFTDEADRLATEINQLASSDVALAVHKKNQVSLNQIRNSPILVITHSAYRNALIEIATDTGHNSQWDRIWGYMHAERSWLIIDEAFDWVQSFEVDLSELSSLCGALSCLPALQSSNALRQLNSFAETITLHARTVNTSFALSSDLQQQLLSLNLAEVQSQITQLSHREVDLWQSFDKPERAIRSAYLALLKELVLIQGTGFGWVSFSGRRIQLNSARLLMDCSKRSGIILDATAATDPHYELLGNRVKVLQRPDGIRNYASVILNVSTGHRVGKEHLVNYATEHWAGLRTILSGKLTADNRMLVCCHKDVEPQLSFDGVNVQTVSTTHWGDLDGKNDWNSYDTGVIFGLPYLDDVAPTNAILACQPERINSWFHGDKTFGSHLDMGQVFKDGFIARSVVQAINRIRCRKAVDELGNCEPVQLFLLLPKGQTGKALLSAIQSQMPNIKTMDWDAGVAVQKTKPVPTEQKLIAFLREAEIGKFTKSHIIEQLRISAKTFERMSIRMQSSSYKLAGKLASIGVRYECSIGRGKEAHFIKQ